MVFNLFAEIVIEYILQGLIFNFNLMSIFPFIDTIKAFGDIRF